MSFDAKQYWDERLSKHYDLVGVGDISLTMNYNIWSYKITKAVLKRLFTKYSTSQKLDVLDIGSGTGFVIDIWKEFPKNIHGIDISSTAVNLLTQKYPDCKFYEIDAGKEPMPFADNQMEVVTASSVLYHLVEDDALDMLLSSVHRVLRKDGYFIFSDNFMHQSNLSITHQKCRTLESYENALKKNGFEIVDRVANYYLFNDPIDAKSKTVPRIWARLTKYSRKWKWFDSIVWPLLYPIEWLLTRFSKESPAQEVMICKAIK